MTKNRMLGKRYDGGLSPLGRSPMLAVNPPPSVDLENTPLSIMHPGEWSTPTQEDYDCIASGQPVQGEWMREKIRLWGMDPDRVHRLPMQRRIRLLNRLVRLSRQLEKERDALLLKELFATDRAPCSPTPEHRSRLFYDVLVPWSRGELRLEKPQGVSLHHLLDYDAKHTKGKFTRTLFENQDTQSIVVENDWARATAGTGLDTTAGEWRLPFEHICWEFRISGVRVIVFTQASEGQDTLLWCVYGKDGHWVIDDYAYHVTPQGLSAGMQHYSRGSTEFPRVTRLVHDNIRVACILRDAAVAREERVPVGKGLNKNRTQKGLRPIRDHFVVRLLDKGHRRTARAKSAGAGLGGGWRQRGHWRPGNWFHYDRQDAGQVQYVNDGGFWVSKTWRSWYFAGDPNNLITKEYRL